MVSKRIMIIAFFALLTLAVVAAFVMKKDDTHGATRTVTVKNVEIQTEVRDTMLGRAQGLSGKPSLPEGEGMLFIFDAPGRYGFWMKDMNFPIDLLWIQDGKIAGIQEHMVPEPEKNMFLLTTYYPPQDVQYVLELPDGDVKKHGFAVGDQVKF